MDLKLNSNNVEILEENDYLLVKCAKDASIEQKEKTLDKIVNYVQDKSITNVLFDLRETLSSMNEDEHLSCGELILNRKNDLSKSKIAFLIKEKEPVLFLSVAYAGGFTNFIEVDCENDASLWFSDQMK